MRNERVEKVRSKKLSVAGIRRGLGNDRSRLTEYLYAKRVIQWILGNEQDRPTAIPLRQVFLATSYLQAGS